MLITGDSDTAITSTFLQHPSVQTLLRNPYLLKWHAQNLATQHPKLFHLPIGLDYHTMWERPGFWGVSRTSPMAQEHQLLSILAASPHLSQRYLAGYCNWHFALHRGDRQECLQHIDKSVCFFEQHPVPRASTWQRQVECMFVISPEGAGMDCHRTWEALLLGNIPIMKRNALSVMFENLPVLIVEEWSTVSRDYLVSRLPDLFKRKYDFSPLFLDYWRRLIRNSQPEPIEPMTMDEFRGLLTRQTG